MQIFFSNNTKCSVQNNASEFVQEYEQIKMPFVIYFSYRLRTSVT